MMKLIIEKNVQIKQMEVEMEKMIKEKEQSQRVAIVPLDAIPFTQVPAIGTTTATNYSTRSTKRSSSPSMILLLRWASR